MPEAMPMPEAPKKKEYVLHLRNPADRTKVQELKTMDDLAREKAKEKGVTVPSLEQPAAIAPPTEMPPTEIPSTELALEKGFVEDMQGDVPSSVQVPTEREPSSQIPVTMYSDQSLPPAGPDVPETSREEVKTVKLPEAYSISVRGTELLKSQDRTAAPFVESKILKSDKDEKAA